MMNYSEKEKINTVTISKEKVYDLMTGTLILEELEEGEADLVVDEFGKGMPCERLYREVYEARCRLCERFDVAEDKDVEVIIDNLLRIGKILSMKMYDYGIMYGEKIAD